MHADICYFKNRAVVLKEEGSMCGVFGVFDVDSAAGLTVLGLHNIQHRAIDYSGIVSSDGEHVYRFCGMGIARRVFTEKELAHLHGRHALGHIRYPTVTDDCTRDNTQPIVGTVQGIPIAIAHNGNITNREELEKLLPNKKFSTSMDTELILRLLEAQNDGDFDTNLSTVLNLLRGSFSLGILLPDRLIAARDPQGNRPLSVAKMNGGYCISSETCAFPSVGAKYEGDIEPGTIVSLSSDGCIITRFADPALKQCQFERIYYAQPASTIFGGNVADFRVEVGKTLEKLFPVSDADIVTPVPDSANFIALGWGENGRSGKYFPVILRNHYVGRTFISPTHMVRDIRVAQKFIFAEDKIQGKSIVVIDDSIVRGTTLPKIVQKLKELGARAIHVRIGSPPVRYSCIYGIDTPSEDELIASRRSIDGMRKLLGADSLEFLPIEELKKLSPRPESFCCACFDGKYW